MIILQLCLFCGLFFLLVRLGAVGGGIKELYFYPIEYQKIAFERGLSSEEETRRRRKRFMIPFMAVMFAALMLIVGLWNRPAGFASAYGYSLLFLEVMNWFDGIVIDKLWVGHSPLWKIPGMEDQPYVQSWRQMKAKRGILTLVFAVLAAVPAGLICLIRCI